MRTTLPACSAGIQIAALHVACSLKKLGRISKQPHPVSDRYHKKPYSDKISQHTCIGVPYLFPQIFVAWLGCPLSTDFKGAVAAEITENAPGKLRVELAMRNQGRDAGQPCCVSLKSCFHSTLHVIRFSGHGMRYFWRGGYRPLNLDFAIIVILTVSGRNLSMTNEQSDSSMLCTQKSGRPTATTRRNISTVRGAAKIHRISTVFTDSLGSTKKEAT